MKDMVIHRRTMTELIIDILYYFYLFWIIIGNISFIIRNIKININIKLDNNKMKINYKIVRI